MLRLLIQLFFLCRPRVSGLCSSCVSDCCSNSLRVVKTSKQTAPVPVSYTTVNKPIPPAPPPNLRTPPVFWRTNVKAFCTSSFRASSLACSTSQKSSESMRFKQLLLVASVRLDRTGERAAAPIHRANTCGPGVILCQSKHDTFPTASHITCKT